MEDSQNSFRSNDPEQNPLTDREFAEQKTHTNDSKMHFPKIPWQLAGIASGVMGIVLAIGGYITVRFILLQSFPFSPEGQAGLGILLSLSSILLSFLIQTVFAYSLTKEKQIHSMLLSWGIFFVILILGAGIITTNLTG